MKRIFLIIQNAYSQFETDHIKAKIWADLLWDTPFELAQKNLRRYIMNPENKYPPHPGELAKRPSSVSQGVDVPNVLETRLSLEREARDREQIAAAALPPGMKERLRQLARR